MPDQYAMQDPTTRFPAPVRERQAEIAHPGLTADMISPPDHGENTYRGSGRLEGRRAIVTGADSGIGRAVAIAFAREGADVVLSYLDEEEQDARETARWVEEAGRKAVSVPGDLRSEEHCSALVETAVRELGGLDILVNNAAFQMVQMGGIADITTEQFDRVMKTNLYALFWLSKAAIAQMEPGSTIVNTSSIQGASPSPELARLRHDKGGHHRLHKGTGRRCRTKGNQGQCRCTWTDLDATDSGHDAQGEVRDVRGTTFRSGGQVSRPSLLPPMYFSPLANPVTPLGKSSA